MSNIDSTDNSQNADTSDKAPEEQGPSLAPNPRYERLVGHVAADAARFLSSQQRQLVESRQHYIDRATDVLGCLVPKRTEELRASLTTFVEVVTDAVAEQSFGELFDNVRDVLRRDPTGYAVRLFSDAFDLSDDLSEMLPAHIEVEIEADPETDPLCDLWADAGYGCHRCDCR